MKILLMNVPDTHVARTSSKWDINATDAGEVPPIGLMYIAGALIRQGRHEVKIIDNMLHRNSVEDIVNIIHEYNPSIIGVGAYTPTFYDTIHICNEVKKVRPEQLIVLGGPHVLYFPNETMAHDAIDYLVLGESEETFPEFCNSLEEGSSFNHITGIVFKKDGKVVQTGPPAVIKNINDSPFPAFNIIDYKRYYNAIGSGNAMAVICSSRGCPFKCTYCCKPDATYRSRSVENVIKEMEQYYNHGIREFIFYDDLFNIQKKRVVEISQAIIERKWKIKWNFRGRVDAVDKEMLDIAKAAGCWQIYYGVEAGTDDGLREIKKNITIDQVKRAVKLTREAGIISSTNWIIGLPHQKSRKDILEQIKTAISIDSVYAQINICLIYEGTEMFREGVSADLIDPDIWKNYVRNPTPNFYEPIWNQYLSRDELSELLNLFYKKFYFRPISILRKLVRMRSWREFMLHVRSALVLLGIGGYHRDKSVITRKKDRSAEC